MRRALVVPLVAAIALAALFAGAAQSPPKPLRAAQDLGPAPASPPPYWQRRGCSHGYSRRAAIRGIRAAVKNYRLLTRAMGRAAQHFAVCASTREKARSRTRYARWVLRVWRWHYGPYWTIRRNANPPSSLQLRVHRCESVSYYVSNGSGHRGGYQYDDGTWGEAQDAAGTPGRYRTGRADVASPAHQDAVTAVFLPGHLSRWDQSRGCWG